MTDIISPERRSRNMSAIHSKNTKPEIFIRKLLFSEGYRYRINEKTVIGHPDIFLRKYNTAIFVNGCFWHRHKNCKYAYKPKTNIEFWEKKFNNNINRDNYIISELKNKKIKCLVIWECTINKMIKDIIFRKEVLKYICFFINSNYLKMEI